MTKEDPRICPSDPNKVARAVVISAIKAANRDRAQEQAAQEKQVFPAFPKPILGVHRSRMPTAADISPGKDGNCKWYSSQWYSRNAPWLEHHCLMQDGVLALAC
jgi:hypothetical protein